MATGTGYPTIKTGGERTAISGTVAADSGASQWQRIANIGEQLSKTAANIGEKEAYAQYVSAVADHEVEGRNFERAARDKHAFDPKGYEATMQGFIAGKLGEMPPQLVPHMKQFYSRQMDSGHSAVMGERRQRDIGLQTNAIVANTTQLSERVIDHGNAGTLDTPEGKKAQQDFVSGVQSGVAAERYSQEQADLTIQQTVEKAQQATTSRKTIDLYREKGYEAAVTFLQKSVRDNTALKMGASDRKKLYEVALTNLNKAQLEDKRFSHEITTDIERSEQQAIEGNPPPPAKMSELEVRVGAVKDPVTTKRMTDAKETIDLATSMRSMTVPQAESKLATDIAAAVNAGDTAGAKRLRDTGEKVLKTMRSSLKDNPLNWAQKVGEVPITPIDFNNPATALPSMQSRIAAAEVFAQKHGVAAQYLLPAEQAALKAQLERGGPQAIKVAEMINQGFGTRAAQVIGEIAKDAPVVSHMGQMAGTNPRFAMDVAETIAAQQDPDYAKRLPRNLNKPDKDTRAAQEKAASATIGGALVLIPNADLTIKGAADAAFISRARRNQKLDPMLLDSDSSKQYNRAIQESAGATYDREGTQRGGITGYGASGIWPFRSAGRQVVVPTTVKTNRFGDVLGAISDTDLAAHPNPPVRAGGQPYTAETLKNATPVLTPDGRGYRFAAGDPGSNDPQWIQGRNGLPFELNWDLIEPTLRKRMPDAF